MIIRFEDTAMQFFFAALIVYVVLQLMFLIDNIKQRRKNKRN